MRVSVFTRISHHTPDGTPSAHGLEIFGAKPAQREAAAMPVACRRMIAVMKRPRHWWLGNCN
jgi:hypothetical protein